MKQNSTKEVEKAFSELRITTMESLMTIPLELSFTPVKALVNLSEDGEPAVYSEITFTDILPEGILITSTGDNFFLEGPQHIYSVEDLVKIKSAVVESALKKLDSAGMGDIF